MSDLTIDTMIPLVTGLFMIAAGCRIFSKKPHMTPWKRCVFASYWLFGAALVSLAIYMLVTGNNVLRR